MKKTFIGLVFGLLIGAAVMAVVFKVPASLFQKSSAGGSFQDVTANLDPGGEAYGYLHAKPFIDKIDQLLELMPRIAAAKPGGNAKEAEKAIPIIKRLIADSGLKELRGIGFSSIAVENDLYRSVLVLDHDADKGKGILWNIGGVEPHPLDELSLLPADTVLADFADFDAKKLWEWLLQEMDALNLPEVKAEMAKVGPTLQAQGVDWDKLLGSFGGRFGRILTLNPEKRISIPIPGQPLQIPEPGLAFAFSVKDGYIFDLIQSKLPMAQKSEDKGTKKLTFGDIPLPISIKPVIAQKGAWLIAASHERLAEAFLDPGADIKRLAETEEYRKLSRKLPTQGNRFHYVGPRFFRELYAVFEKALSAQAAKKGGNPSIKEILNLIPKEFSYFAVGRNTTRGMILTANHSFDTSIAMMIPTAAFAGAMASVALPNILTAREKGKQTSTRREN